MAFPLAAGAAASAFGSQPFGKAMDGFNKANGPQPLNYEEWKANTGQAGAKGYQDYSGGFTATPAKVAPPPTIQGGAGAIGQAFSPQPPAQPQRQSPITQSAQVLNNQRPGVIGEAANIMNQGYQPPQPPPEQNYGMKAAQPGAPVQPPPNVDMEALIKMLMSSGLGQQVGNTQMFQNLLGRFRQ